MKATEELRREHTAILNQASTLSGLASSRMTRDTAEQTAKRIASIDRLLVAHLTTEDDWLYPTLMAADDRDVREVAAECSEDMGGILGAWIAYRDQWTAQAILTDSKRFAAATAGVIGALAMRVERENSQLYPLMDTLLDSRSGEFRAA